MDDYRLIAELARMAGISGKTARRHVKTFPEQFPGQAFGRTVRYPLEAADTLRRIADLYGEGLGTEDIRQRLAGRESGEPEGMLLAAPSAGAGTPDAGRDAGSLRAGVERLMRELAMARDETGRLAGELAGERDAAGRLRSELAATRAMVERMACELAEARGETGRWAARMAAIEEERQELEERLDARLAALEALQGPSPDFMRLPIVFRSEQGEFLGVSDKQTSQHFSLRDFVYLIHKNAGGRKDVDTAWQRLGGAGWRLVIHESAPRSGRRKSHHVDVERFITPMGNLVARLVDLCFDGQTMPPFLVYELFRQIGRDFS